MRRARELPRAVIAGGSGFIGRELARLYTSEGYEVVVLSRSQRPVEGVLHEVWDGKSVGSWRKVLEGADVLINLSGEGIFKRWNSDTKRRLVSSRVESTRALALAVEECASPPKSWVNSSAVGFYGDRGEDLVTEGTGPGTDFLANLCQEWEGAQEACSADILKCQMRTGFVLGREGGAFPLMRNLTAWFLGSPLGSGKQWMPWIHVQDLARAFLLCSERRLAGPINGVGPNPARNLELMAALRKLMGRPWVPPVPRLVLDLASRFVLPPVEVTLVSQKVLPQRLNELDFQFRYPMLHAALRGLLDEA